jgi:hypothetical protein
MSFHPTSASTLCGSRVENVEFAVVVVTPKEICGQLLQRSGCPFSVDFATEFPPCFSCHRQYLALKSEPSRADVTSASQEIEAWLQTFGAGRGASKHATSDGGVEDSWTPKEREFAANREKIKGNEAFRAGETEKAIAHYTKSLELKPRDAVVLANRCCQLRDERVVCCRANPFLL